MGFEEILRGNATYDAKKSDHRSLKKCTKLLRLMKHLYF